MLLLAGSVAVSFASSNQTIGENSMTDGTLTSDQNVEYMNKISSEEGVVTTASGLKYKILTAGSGQGPTATSSVTVNYEGKLTNGSVFDSSYQRGTPATFGVSDVISGWTEALQLMQPGSVWELYIPPELAYGARGIPGVIPANSVLVFKVELISVS